MSPRAEHARAFDVSDYSKLKEPFDLVLSADGKWLAYSVAAASQKYGENRESKSYVVEIDAGQRPRETAIPPRAMQLTWVPRSRRIAYLSTSGTGQQVFTYDVESGAVQQRTDSAFPVNAFAYDPSGQAFAFIRYVSHVDSTSPLRKRATGILLDPDTASVYDFVTDADISKPSAGRGELWIEDANGKKTRANIPGSVEKFSWSKDGRSISVVYVAEGVVPQLTRQPPTSVGVLDVKGSLFKRIALGVQGGDYSSSVVYSGGEWFPDNRHIVIRRTINRKPWVDLCFSSWSVVPVRKSKPLAESQWKPVEMCEPAEGARVFPMSASTVLAENTERGIRSLFLWSVADIGQWRPLLALAGSQSQFAFSADMNQMAFVQQSLRAPPQICVQHTKGESAPAIVRVNELDALERMAISRRVEWKSIDGATVEGWLLEPSDNHQGPRPLVTFLHGGPASVVVDAFAQYYPIWPYPFEAYAANGIAVFFPNYRGTWSYGRGFMSPSSVDREPIDDVLSGIEFLVDEGLADKSKLALSGHSHGAWLGAMILTRSNIFAAASFAEGLSNMMTTYDLMPGELNRSVQDFVLGGSPFDHASRYVDLSPSLHFGSVSTPVLFESGGQSGALLNLGFAKAAKRFGVPSESYVYPTTGHVVTDSEVQREVALRNLRWLRFWLLEDAANDPLEPELARWRKLQMDRAQQLSR